MKALYRKYRPVKLEDVVGQEQVTTPLSNALKQGKISHAYLFIGPRGCGKTSVARIFAHEVNGFPYEIEDDYVDIIEIDGASNRGIDDIRELREKVAIAPTAGKYKVYIIDEVHMLTKEAFNALLKTLEEPPEHAIFIMATTDAYKVPVTITSRAQTYTFKLADVNVMLEFLKGVCEKEGIKIDEGALKIIATRGGGSFRDTLSLLDQISTLADDTITEELVISSLGLPNVVKITTLFEDFTSGDVVKITTDLKDLLATGVKAETVAEEMIAEIIANPRPELLPLLSKLPDVKPPYAEARLLIALTNNIKVETVVFKQEIKKEIIKEEVKNEPKEEIKKVEKNEAEKVEPPRPVNSDFNKDEFIEKVARMNDGIAAQLKTVEIMEAGGVLEIYPKKRITKTILSRENNKRILSEAAGMRVNVHEVGENAENDEKDVLISKMSAIMGGEVMNDGGDSPF